MQNIVEVVGDPRRQALKGGDASGTGPAEVLTPMPGKVIRVDVELGQPVDEGDPLVVVEAMKMENIYKSPRDGVVAAIYVKAGQTLEAGAKMLRVDPLPQA